MSKKGCELCKNPARMFCESDQASLCWDCDEKVHGANFLVAKHTRCLLCHVCQSPTPWKAAGPKLGSTVSVCHVCAENQLTTGRRNGDEDGDSQESETDGEEYDSDNDDCSDEEEEDDDENQVVPWSNSNSTPPSPSRSPAASPPPPVASSSGSEDADNVSFTSFKRIRETPFESEDEDGCCSSQLESKFVASILRSSNCFQESQIVGSSSRPLKLQRVEATGEEPPVKTRTAAIVGSLRKLQQEIVSSEGDASAVILGIQKLSRDS